MNKKASVSIYLALIITLIIIVTVTVVVAPMGTLFTAEMYAAGEDILARANESIQNIQNDTVRSAVTAGISNAQDASQFNMEVTTDMFQYSWVFIVLLAALVAFLFTRSLTEVTRGSGGFI